MNNFKFLAVFAGDAAIFFLSLALAIYLRQPVNFPAVFREHFLPFSFIFVFWTLVFYLFNLYEPKNFKNDLALFKNFILSLVFNAAAAVIFLYFFAAQFQNVSPKTIFFLFVLIFGLLGFLWRYFFNYFNNIVGAGEKILFILPSEQRYQKSVGELSGYLKNHPHLGYEIKYQLPEGDISQMDKIPDIIRNHQINLIIIPAHLKEKKLSRAIYDNLALGIALISWVEFYEIIFKKIPLAELEESWFLENIAFRHQIYDAVKGITEAILSSILIIILSPLFVLIFILIKITSRGPAIYRQKRTGQKEKIFTLYKFRTMRIDQEGPLWTDKNDRRLTFAGKILRYSHLDELPQLWNILKGDISFVGPRPERVELSEQYKQLPFYEIRHIIKPGLTGWAQINYQPSVSLEEAYEKLQYDVYYIENRSLFLDFLILVKTIKHLFAS